MSDRVAKILIIICLVGALICGFLAWGCYQKMQAYEEMGQKYGTSVLE